MKKIILILLSASCFLHAPLCFSQNARSLFSAGSGATFESKAANSPQAGAVASSVPQAGATTSPDYTGLSYSLFLESQNGSVNKVSPKRVFKTGDRIQVVVRANKDGFLSVVNINPQGKSSVVSEQRATAGVDMNVPEKGFLKFVGAKGAEHLVFVLSAKPLSQAAAPIPNMAAVVAAACGSAKGGTRSLVADDSAGNEFSVVESNGSCAEKKGTTRSLVVEVSDDSGYGVVPAATIASGQILTLRVVLRHE